MECQAQSGLKKLRYFEVPKQIVEALQDAESLPPLLLDLIVLERLRLANNEALAHDITWMPAAIAAPLLDIDFTSTGLYAELQRTCNVSMDAGHERITTLLAPRHIAQLLGITVKDPVFLIERRATAQGRPAIWRETHIRGDHFSLETDWSPTTSSTTAITTPSNGATH